MDIRTIVLILGFTHLMQVIVFFYQYKVNKTYNGIGWWLLWSLVEIMGFVCLLLRGIPSIFSAVVIVQNTAIISGTIFIYIGIMRFFNKKENLQIIVPLFLFFLSGFLYFLFIENNIQIRSILISATLAFISFLTAFSLYKNKIKSISTTVNFNTLIFILHGSIFSYRTIMIMAGNSVTDIFTPTLFNIVPYFDALIVALLWTFGFVLMVNHRLNSEITEAKEHFENIFNTSPDAAVITRMEDRVILDTNAAFESLTGFTREESVGKSSIDLHLWKNPEDQLRLISELIEKGYSDNVEAAFHRKDGTELIGLMSAKKIMLQGIAHSLSITRDITDRKKNEEKLKEYAQLMESKNRQIGLQNQELERLNLLNQKIFSVISHDFKGPVISLQLLLKTLENKNVTEEQIALYTRDISNQLIQANLVLDNLLNWAKTELNISVREQLSANPFYIANEIKSQIQSMAEKKNIKINNNIPEPVSLHIPPDILRIVLRNLLSNAIKFSFENSSVDLEYDYKTNLLLVKDFGQGLDDNKMKQLFKKDVAPSLGTWKETGFGLGLYITSELLHRFHGSISAQNNNPSGVIFSIHIPGMA